MESKRVRVRLSLSGQQIEMVRKSWNEMLSDNPEETTNFASSLFCLQFYNNLLAMEPDLVTLFPSIKHQATSFAGVLNSAIINLEDLSLLDAPLEDLGRRHARILGISPPYFKLMGDALIKTFRDRFQTNLQNFPVQLEELWIQLYCFLANSILQGGVDPVIVYAEEESDSASEIGTQSSMHSAQTSSHSTTQSARNLISRGIKNYKASAGPDYSVRRGPIQLKAEKTEKKKKSRLSRKKGQEDSDCIIVWGH